MADTEKQPPGGAADGNPPEADTAPEAAPQDPNLAENSYDDQCNWSPMESFSFTKRSFYHGKKSSQLVGWILYTLKYIYMLLTLWTLPFIYAFGFMGATFKHFFLHFREL